MQAEIDYLKAQLAHTEQELLVSEAVFEFAEGIIAKHEEQVSRRDDIEHMLPRQLYLAQHRNRLSGLEVESE